MAVSMVNAANRHHGFAYHGLRNLKGVTRGAELHFRPKSADHPRRPSDAGRPPKIITSPASALCQLILNGEGSISTWGCFREMHWKRPLSFSMERQLVDDRLQMHESRSRRTAVSEVGIRNL